MSLFSLKTDQKLYLKIWITKQTENGTLSIKIVFLTHYQLEICTIDNNFNKQLMICIGFLFFFFYAF